MLNNSRFLRDGVVALVSVTLSLLLSFNARAAINVNGESVSSGASQATSATYTPDILSTDLIDSSQPSFSSVVKDKTPFFESTTLNDGIGCPPTGTALGTYLPATFGAAHLPFTYTYTLDTSVNVLGYDINEVCSYAGWNANGSALGNQKYEVLVSTIETNGFISLGVFTYAPFNSSHLDAASATKMLLSESGGGAITTGVDAIRFVFLDHSFANVNAGIDGTVYYEVDVIGQPTAGDVQIPAVVSSYSYDGSGQGSQPSTSPAWPDSGGVELINGILPSNAHYTDPEWVGFLDDAPDDGTSHPRVTFALDKEYDLSKITIVYFHSTGQAGGTVTAAEEVLVSFSTDGTIWSSPVSFSSEFNHAAGDEIRTAELDVAVSTASFVRLDFRNSSPWTFLAELSFEASGGNPQHFALEAAIADAQLLYDGSVEGTADGEYPAGARATLFDAINAAQSVDDNSDATFIELRAAEDVLKQAMDDFRASVNGGLPVLNHILGTGQSLSVGWSGGPPLSTTQPYNNLMLSGVGQTGTDLVPLVEGPNLNNAPVETISSALGNTLTALSPYNRYTSIVTRHGQGGVAYAGLKKGTSWYAKGMGQVSKAQAAALATGHEYRVAAVTTVHGESDHAGGNGPNYAGYLKEWQADYDADVKALTGQINDVPMFLCQMSSHTIYNTATSVVPAQQLWAAENSRYHTLVCPKYFLTYSDGVHLTSQSYRHLGEYYGKALKRVLVDEKEWQPLAPVKIMRSGAVVTVDFMVPSPPLMIDTNAVLAHVNYGFEYADDSSSATISSVAVVDSDTIEITLSAAPSGANPRLRYAYTGDPGSWSGCDQSGSARGNIRDSDATPSLYGNNLYNWLVHFDHPVPFDPSRDDFDGDGVPDRWENLNFGGTNVSHGMSSNADADPMDDYAEWAAGTDPNNAGDFFRIYGESAQSGGAFEVSWDTLLQRNYSLFCATGLSHGTVWSNLFVAAGTGRRITFTNDWSLEDRCFFKVELTPQ